MKRAAKFGRWEKEIKDIRAEVGKHLHLITAGIRHEPPTTTESKRLSYTIEPERTKIRTVASVDMVCYGSVSTQFEKLPAGDTTSVSKLNDFIQSLIEKAIEEANQKPKDVPTISTGDGALLFFDSETGAAKFAVTLRDMAEKDNAHKGRKESNRLLFRIGIATGDITSTVTRSSNGELLTFRAAGITIAHAVRIQTDCEPGQNSVAISTYDKIDDAFVRGCFYFDGEVSGKSHENLGIKVKKSPGAPMTKSGIVQPSPTDQTKVEK